SAAVDGGHGCFSLESTFQRDELFQGVMDGVGSDCLAGCSLRPATQDGGSAFPSGRDRRARRGPGPAQTRPTPKNPAATRLWCGAPSPLTTVGPCPPASGAWRAEGCGSLPESVA